MTQELTTRNAGSIVEILRSRAERDGARLAFTYLRDGEHDEVSMTYGELHERSVAIAASIREIARPGERALLLYPPGLEFIHGFFGCLYAGLIAVPAYPPPPARALRHAERLDRIVGNAGATVLLGTGEYLQDLQPSPRVAGL